MRLLCVIFFCFCCNVATWRTRGGTNDQEPQDQPITGENESHTSVASLLVTGPDLNSVAILNLTLPPQRCKELPFRPFAVSASNSYGKANLQLLLSRPEDLLSPGDPVKDILGC